MATATLIFYEGPASGSTAEGGPKPVELPGRMLPGTVVITYGTSSPVTPPAGARIVEVQPDDADGAGYIWIEPEPATMAATKYVPIISAKIRFFGLINGDQIAHSAGIPA